ncbi:concanavalin A-like lectin/glucanase domain-containing protein [Mycena pura]|uniref:Concanavalin A-like lectin/glucanase domain-containing protein n=1 Tax=Mycena pura TaxID=153505 RepID=A0AAD6YMD8_9AGAR|nr:concanavalin A-like lectin/glucanase domain-containing protein [Mycena pura]
MTHLFQTEAPSESSLSACRKAGPSSRESLSPTTHSEEDGSPPPRQLNPALNPSPQILHLPITWSERYCHELLSISPDGRDVTYQGMESIIFLTYNYTPWRRRGLDILSRGNKGHISIGFAGQNVKLSRLPGWEPDSWGYHGDDGRSFAAKKNGTPYGPTFGTGDVIGCGIDFNANQAFFTKNGTFIGTVFKDIDKTIELYPSIGLRHSDEAVRANFGQDPFRFDIEYYVHQQPSQTWSNTLTTPANPSLVCDDKSGEV